MDIIPFDDRDGFIWMNGTLTPWRDAKTHVLNHGLHYGSCVFEGIRVYNGKAFKLREHSERLHTSAALLGFKIPYSVEDLDKATKEIIKVQNIENGYVRPLAWRGSEQMAILAQLSKVHVAIATWAWPAYYTDEAKRKGAKLTYAKWRRPSPDTAPCASKAAGLYMICTLSKNEAAEKGCADAVMLDWQGRVAEATSANIFMVFDGELHTPIADCFLDGITRRTVMSLAKKQKIKVVERRILPEEMKNASEVFLTGTAAEITPVSSLDEISFNVGRMTRQLMTDFDTATKS